MRRINLWILVIGFAGITFFLNSCKDPCKDVFCENNGVCIEGDCDCPNGFSGTNCENNDLEKTATLQIKLNPTFGDKSIELYNPVTDENGQAIFQLEKLYFYISDLRLDSETAQEEILLVDAGDPNYETGTTKIKPGNYSSLTLGLGVEERLNHADPASYENDHPLGSGHTDKHWIWETGYIFYKIEGLYSAKDDGVLDGDFLFHMGTDELYRTITINKAVNLVKEGITEIILNIDFEKLFFTQEGIDLKVENTTQAATEQAELNEKFINRLIESIE